MAVINKKAFERLKKKFETADATRETIIKDSRDILKLSKAAIYSIHRGELDSAKSKLAKAKTSIAKLKKKLSSSAHTGSFSDAVQEYVEAATYYSFIKHDTIPTDKDLNVSEEDYLLGLCDLTGELGRKAINDSIKGNYKETIHIKDVVSDIYSELMRFDFRNSQLRKKFDSIKYDLKKLEDLVLQLKLKDKL